MPVQVRTALDRKNAIHAQVTNIIIRQLQNVSKTQRYAQTEQPWTLKQTTVRP